MNATPQTIRLLPFFLALGLASCGGDERSQPVATTINGIPAVGAAEPKVVVSLFLDYQCPFYRRMGDVSQRLLDRWPDEVQVRFHPLPLPQHDLAIPAARVSLAAHRQGRFMCMHQALTKTAEVWASSDQLNFDALVKNVLAPRCGLAPEVLERDLADPALTDAVIASRERARDFGVTAVPYMYVNGLTASKAEADRRTSATSLSALITRELADIAAGGRGLGNCPANADWQCLVRDRVGANLGDEAAARLLVD